MNMKEEYYFFQTFLPYSKWQLWQMTKGIFQTVKSMTFPEEVTDILIILADCTPSL